MALALLVAEVDVPPLATAGAMVAAVGALAWAARAGLPFQAARYQPALVAAAVAVVLGAVVVVSLALQTAFFVRHDLREAGTAQQRAAPMPEETVRTARTALQGRRTWALVTAAGRCDADAYRYEWLAFRLQPHVPDCHHPDVEVLIGVPAPPDAHVASAGQGWSVVYP